MAVTLVEGVLSQVDSKGNMTLVYPITKTDCLEDYEETTKDEMDAYLSELYPSK